MKRLIYQGLPNGYALSAPVAYLKFSYSPDVSKKLLRISETLRT